MRARFRGMTLQTLLRHTALPRSRSLRSAAGSRGNTAGASGMASTVWRQIPRCGYLSGWGFPLRSVIRPVDPVSVIKRPRGTPPKPRGRPRKPRERKAEP